jgi:hypothetical protein
MYSSEIEEFIRSKDYRLSISEYMEMMKNSNQIKYVTFDTREWSYKLVTDDDYELFFSLYE